MKFLVVDDSITMRRIVTNVVKQLDTMSEIIQAEDGLVAWELFQKHKDFDVVLCDINMPNMNGFEVVEKIRTIDKKVFFCFITTEGGKSEVIKGLKLGANNYIVKPFSADTLKEKLKPYINNI